MGSVGKGVSSVLTFGLGGKLLSDQKKKMQQSLSLPPATEVQAKEPPQELKAPTIDDAAPAAKVERKKNVKQRGRASTVLLDVGSTGSTAKTTLG